MVRLSWLALWGVLVAVGDWVSCGQKKTRAFRRGQESNLWNHQAVNLSPPNSTSLSQIERASTILMDGSFQRRFRHWPTTGFQGQNRPVRPSTTLRISPFPLTAKVILIHQQTVFCHRAVFCRAVNSQPVP